MVNVVLPARGCTLFEVTRYEVKAELVTYGLIHHGEKVVFAKPTKSGFEFNYDLSVAIPDHLLDGNGNGNEMEKFLEQEFRKWSHKLGVSWPESAKEGDYWDKPWPDK